MDAAFIKELLFALQREVVNHRKLCVIIFAIVSMLILVVSFFIPKKYTTEAVLYADETNIIQPLLEGRAEVTEIDSFARAKEVIYTRKILEKVALDSGLIDKGFAPSKKEAVVISLRKNIKVRKMGKTHFKLVYENVSADQSFEVLKNTVSAFIENTAKQKKEESLGAFQFIDAQVQSYKKQLELAEDKLKEFKSANLDGTESEVNSKIAKLRDDIEQINLEIEDSQARIKSIKQQLNSESEYQITKSKLDSYRNRKLLLIDELEQLRLSYQESYPDIVAIKTQITEIDNQLSKQGASTQVSSGNSEQVVNPLFEELRKQLSVVEVDVLAQQRRKRSLDRLLKREYERAERIATNQAELTELTRDYDVTRSVYEEMLERKESARLSMTLDLEGQGISYKIQEPAIYPLSPTGLQFIHVALLGPILGLLAPLGILFAYIFLDPRFRSASKLKDAMPEGVELLGAIPHYNTPLGERVVRSDIIYLLAAVAATLVLYGIIVAIKLVFFN